MKQLISCAVPNLYTVTWSPIFYPFFPVRETLPWSNKVIESGIRLGHLLSGHGESGPSQSHTNLWFFNMTYSSVRMAYKGIVTMQFSKHFTSLLLGDFWNDNWNIMFCSPLQRENHILCFLIAKNKNSAFN